MSLSNRMQLNPPCAETQTLYLDKPCSFSSSPISFLPGLKGIRRNLKKTSFKMKKGMIYYHLQQRNLCAVQRQKRTGSISMPIPMRMVNKVPAPRPGIGHKNPLELYNLLISLSTGTSQLMGAMHRDQEYSISFQLDF